MHSAILKSAAEIEGMRPACVLAAQALKIVGGLARPGVTTRELDEAAERHIRGHGGVPLFKNYPADRRGVAPFPGTICASVNEEVVHGVPGDRVLREGDIISVDVGARLGEFCGDCAETFAVGEIGRKAEKLLAATRAALRKGIAAMRAGALMRELSQAVQREAESAGFSVVRQFVGHGIGREMHEPPEVPNFVGGIRDGASPLSFVKRFLGQDGPPRKPDPGDFVMETGLVLAIEPMVNAGRYDVLVDAKNGWTVRTKDRTLSAHFEHTVALTENGPVILTVDNG